MRVVIADDSKIMLDVAASLCMQCKYEVVAACENGKDALAAILKYKPDFALLDYIMSPMTGGEVALELAKKPQIKTKIILATSMGQKTAAFNSDLKVAGVVIKPLSRTVLVQAVQIAFGK